MLSINSTVDASFSAYASQYTTGQDAYGVTYSDDSGLTYASQGGSASYSDEHSSRQSGTDVSTWRHAEGLTDTIYGGQSATTAFTHGFTHDSAAVSETGYTTESFTASDTSSSFDSSEDSSADPTVTEEVIIIGTTQTSYDRTVTATVTTSGTRQSANSLGPLTVSVMDVTTHTTTATQQTVPQTTVITEMLPYGQMTLDCRSAEITAYTFSWTETFGTATLTRTTLKGNEAIIIPTSFTDAPDFLTNLATTTNIVKPTATALPADLRAVPISTYTEQETDSVEALFYTSLGTTNRTTFSVKMRTLTYHVTQTTSDSSLTFHVLTSPTTSYSATFTSTTYEPYTTTGTTEDFSTWTTTTSWTEHSTYETTYSSTASDSYLTTDTITTTITYTVYHTTTSTSIVYYTELEPGTYTLASWYTVTFSTTYTNETSYTDSTATSGWSSTEDTSYIETDTTSTVTYWTSGADPITISSTQTYLTGSSTETWTWTWEDYSATWSSWTEMVEYWGPDTIWTTTWGSVNNSTRETTIRTLTVYTITDDGWTSSAYETTFTESTTIGVTETFISYIETTQSYTKETDTVSSSISTWSYTDWTTATNTAITVTITSDTTDGSFYTTTSTLWTWATSTSVTSTGVSSIPATITLLRTESFAPWDAFSTYTTTVPSVYLTTSSIPGIVTATATALEHHSQFSFEGWQVTMSTVVETNATVQVDVVISVSYPDAATTSTASTTIMQTRTASTLRGAGYWQPGWDILDHSSQEHYPNLFATEGVLFYLSSVSTKSAFSAIVTYHSDGPWSTYTETGSASGSTTVSLAVQYDWIKYAGFTHTGATAANTELCPVMGNGLRPATDEIYTAPLYTSVSFSVPLLVTPIWSKDTTTTSTGTATSDTASTTSAGTVGSRTTSTMTWEAWSLMQETSGTAAISFTGTSSHTTSRLWTDLQACTMTTTGTGQTTSITTTDPFTFAETITSVYSGASLFLTRAIPVPYSAGGGKVFSIDGRYPDAIFQTTTGTYCASVVLAVSITSSTHLTTDQRTLDMSRWDNQGPTVMGGHAAVSTVQPVASWNSPAHTVSMWTHGASTTFSAVIVGIRQTVYPRTGTASSDGTVQSWTTTSAISTWISTVALSQLVGMEPCTVAAGATHEPIRNGESWFPNAPVSPPGFTSAIPTFRYGLVFSIDTAVS